MKEEETEERAEAAGSGAINFFKIAPGGFEPPSMAFFIF